MAVEGAGGRLRTRRRSGRAAAARRRRRSGFSLLEATIALSLLSFGMLAMMAGQLTATRMASESRGKMLAAFLAEQQIEMMRAMSPSEVTDLITAPGYPNDPANPIYPVPGDSTSFTRRWTVEPDTPATGAMRITVEVDYVDETGVTRTIRLQSIKAA